VDLDLQRGVGVPRFTFVRRVPLSSSAASAAPDAEPPTLEVRVSESAACLRRRARVIAPAGWPLGLGGAAATVTLSAGARQCPRLGPVPTLDVGVDDVRPGRLLAAAAALALGSGRRLALDKRGDGAVPLRGKLPAARPPGESGLALALDLDTAIRRAGAEMEIELRECSLVCHV